MKLILLKYVPDYKLFLIIGLKIEPVASNNPNDFYLYQNYPNPFNPSTSIKYYLPKSSKVSLKIYNILGQEVHTLIDTYENAGLKSVLWNGKNKNDKTVSSGIYFYRLEAGEVIKNRKMIFLK